MSADVEAQRVKVLVLGAGPAGLSAALYAARAELSPVVLTGMQLGGQAAITHMIENYPGFPEGVNGAELGDLLQKQAERFGATFVFDQAASVDLSKRPFKVTTDGAAYTADVLIIATGASSVNLNVPGEQLLTGRGVSYCATCDGAFFKERKVVVVGGGDSALEEALFLTRYASSITIVHRRNELRAGALLQKRAREHPKIKFQWNSVVTEVQGTEKVTGVKLKDTVTGAASYMETEGLFVFIGHTPNTGIFKGQLDLDSLGFIKVDSRQGTSVHGVFAAGEAADPVFKQVVTSAGQGAAAAIAATRLLEDEEK